MPRLQADVAGGGSLAAACHRPGLSPTQEQPSAPSPLPLPSFFAPPRGGLQAFRPPSASPDSSSSSAGRREEGGGGGRQGEKGERGKGNEKAGGACKEADGGGAGSGSAIILGSLDTLASVASRVTLSSYHALVRASLRRALECGTWRSYACWQCAGVSELGRPHSVAQVGCPALRPAAGKALEALDVAARRDKSIGSPDTAAGGGAVVVAPPLFGSEVALLEHLSHAHDLTLGGMRVGGVTDRLRRCPQEALPAEPSEQMLDALLGVRGMGMVGRGGQSRLSRRRPSSSRARIEG